jgi:hypothetical protein
VNPIRSAQNAWKPGSVFRRSFVGAVRLVLAGLTTVSCVIGINPF